MNKYYPSYYKEFSCLADKCPDTCCAKWEITIDDETLRKYNSLNDEFSDKIKRNLIRNEEDEICFRLKDDRCPFLNENGLCDIHINLGEEYTSKICRNHPRFIEEYDGFTEVSLSLSCPETVNILFAKDTLPHIYPVPGYNGDDDVLELLIKSRKKLLDFNGGFNVFSEMILDEAARVQFNIDMTYIQSHPSICIDFIQDYLDMLLNGCDILDSSWETVIEKTLESDVTTDELKDYIESNNTHLMNLSKYFIYRYYLKAINDDDLYSRALFIVMSCIIICCIAMSNSISLGEAARRYCKETEHNLDNIDALLDYFFDL